MCSIHIPYKQFLVGHVFVFLETFVDSILKLNLLYNIYIYIYMKMNIMLISLLSKDFREQ